jgi:hypothetical protein
MENSDAPEWSTVPALLVAQVLLNNDDKPCKKGEGRGCHYDEWNKSVDIRHTDIL